jgi:hypothetical protein
VRKGELFGDRGLERCGFFADSSLLRKIWIRILVDGIFLCNESRMGKRNLGD